MVTGLLLQVVVPPVADRVTSTSDDATEVQPVSVQAFTVMDSPRQVNPVPSLAISIWSREEDVPPHRSPTCTLLTSS